MKIPATVVIAIVSAQGISFIYLGNLEIYLEIYLGT